ncbi:MAG: DUF86 domain-containing protein [Oscillospiraceae bacterium]|nr:DUF86 domain-containing protein [Oscillospiraceae bacterium]
MDIFKAFAFDLLQLGELAGKVDDEFRKRHPNIPWFDIKGVRNRMAHGYEGVNLNIFRDIVLEHIPLLHEQLSSISEYGSQYPEVADIS